jgi:excinuclease ABC subunit A
MTVSASSDWIIDIGPGAGDEGGRIVASGTPAQVAAETRGQTASCLAAII